MPHLRLTPLRSPENTTISLHLIKRRFMNHRRLPKLLCLMAVIPLAYTACTPKETQALLQPGSTLGAVLAEETIRAAGPKKNIAVITHDANWGPTSTVEEAFQAALRKQGFS